MGKFNKGVQDVERTAHLISLLSEFVYMWKPLRCFPTAVIQSFYYYLLDSSDVVLKSLLFLRIGGFYFLLTVTK